MSEEEKTNKLVIVLTHGADDHDRSTIAMVMANAALTMDVDTKVILQADAVMLARKGIARHVNAPNLPPLEDLIKSYVDQGGRFYVCTPCCQSRKIEKVDLIESATLVTSGFVIDEVTSSCSVLCY